MSRRGVTASGRDSGGANRPTSLGTHGSTTEDNEMQAQVIALNTSGQDCLTGGRPPAVVVFFGTTLRVIRKALGLVLAHKDPAKTLQCVHEATAALESARWVLEYEIAERAEASK